ncbi:MAG: hypothetical protein IPI29_09235 [Ignavibacteria bacterium]|nr:hypothetical protein [Ignavibacteria bacterium]
MAILNRAISCLLTVVHRFTAHKPRWPGETDLMSPDCLSPTKTPKADPRHGNRPSGPAGLPTVGGLTRRLCRVKKHNLGVTKIIRAMLSTGLSVQNEQACDDKQEDDSHGCTSKFMLCWRRSL